MFDTHRFATGLIRDSTPDNATFYGLQLRGNAPLNLPCVVISVTGATDVPNGRLYDAGHFTINVQVYGDDVTGTYDVALSVYDSVREKWRTGYTNSYGYISHIRSNSTGPVQTSSTLDADDSARFDLIFNLVARATTHKE